MAKFKINLVGDTAEQEVSVNFTPKLKKHLIQMYSAP